MERELIRDRTNAGLAAVRARGRLGGRKPKLDAARKLLAAKVEVGVVAKNLGVLRTTLYRSLTKLGGSTPEIGCVQLQTIGSKNRNVPATRNFTV